MAKFLIQSVPNEFPQKFQINLPFYKRNIVFGQVKEGVLKPGMKLNVENKIMEIDRIEMNNRELKEANVGDEVALIIKNGDITILERLVGQEVEFS